MLLGDKQRELEILCWPVIKVEMSVKSLFPVLCAGENRCEDTLKVSLLQAQMPAPVADSVAFIHGSSPIADGRVI